MGAKVKSVITVLHPHLNSWHCLGVTPYSALLVAHCIIPYTPANPGTGRRTAKHAKIHPPQGLQGTSKRQHSACAAHKIRPPHSARVSLSSHVTTSSSQDKGMPTQPCSAHHTSAQHNQSNNIHAVVLSTAPTAPLQVADPGGAV